jgi:uncharacterized membrane protein YebE (DUF533 family)
VTRLETFAASALQGLLAARTNLDIEGEIEMAWRYADGMEAKAKRREAGADEAPDECEPITLTADVDFALALAEGLPAAAAAGYHFSNRERRIIGEVLDAYGTASDVGAPFSGRCELTHRFCEVCRFSFPAHSRELEPRREVGQCSG